MLECLVFLIYFYLTNLFVAADQWNDSKLKVRIWFVVGEGEKILEQEGLGADFEDDGVDEFDNSTDAAFLVGVQQFLFVWIYPQQRPFLIIFLILLIEFLKKNLRTIECIGNAHIATLNDNIIDNGGP